MITDKLFEYKNRIGILESSIISLKKSNVTTTDLTFKIQDLKRKLKLIVDQINEKLIQNEKKQESKQESEIIHI